LFKTENQPGIKVVDPEHMLGVTRVMSELPDGTRIMRLTQIAYVEQVWAEFGHFRKGKRKPSTPMPGKGVPQWIRQARSRWRLWLTAAGAGPLLCCAACSKAMLSSALFSAR
jgi:hypothetical protein